MEFNNTPAGPMRRPARSTFVSVACLTAVVACSGEGPATAPELSASAKASSPFIRLVDPAGCVIEQITAADHDEFQVTSVSPDGKLLAIAARRSESEPEEAYEIDLATGERTALARALTNAGPYSPDQAFIVVAQTTPDGKTDIFEYERATGELTVVAPHEEWDWLPAYSPDGRFIAFDSYRVDGQADIYLFEKATGTLTRLTEDPRYEAHPQFSPDGKRILYHRQQSERDDGGYVFDLFVHDMETGEKTQLTNGSVEQGYGAWAPDGRHLVFSSDIDGKPTKPNLYVRAPNGETTARLTKGIWKDAYSIWTQDGKYIYFNSDRDGVSNVYRMLMNGFDCVRQES